jgi:hypothetical protein
MLQVARSGGGERTVQVEILENTTGYLILMD